MKKLESYYNIDKYLDTNKYLNIDKYLKTGLEYTPKYNKLNLKSTSNSNYPPIEEDRSIIDRLFDVLSVGNYTIAGAFKSFQDRGNLWSGAWEGLKASNPFGSGYTKGEVTWSDVLENSGWKTNTIGASIGRGTTGFLLDVLLDPLTYATFGGAAVVKGTGKAALKATHGNMIRKIADEFGVDISEGLTEEAAKKIILKQSFRRNYDIADDVLEGEAKSLVKRFNNVLGIRPDARDITFGLKNMPFGEKLFPNSKVVELVDGKTLQKLGDSTGIAPKYAMLRDKIYGSALGKHFSTITPLYHLSKTDPGAFYDFVKHTDYVRGLNADRLVKNQMIIKAAKELADLTPAENKKLIELVEDASKWHYVTDTVNYLNTKVGQRKRVELAAKTEQTHRKLAELVEKRDFIQNTIANSEGKIDKFNESLAKLEKEYQNELFNIDVKNISESSTRQRYIELFQDEIDRIEAQKAQIVPKASKMPVDEKSAIHEESIKEIQERVATLKLEAKNITKQLKKLKQEETRVVKNLNKEKEKIATTIDAEKQSEVEKLMKRMDEIRNEYKETQSKDYSSLHKPLIDEWEEFKVKNEVSQSVEEKRMLRVNKIDYARKLSRHLTGNENAISFTTYDANIETIIDMMRKGVPQEKILEFISEHSKYFDGTHSAMHSWIAKQLDYDKWADKYWEPRKELLKAIREEGMTSHNTFQYDKLEILRQKRQFLISKLEDSKDAKELMRRISDFEDMMLMSERKDVIYRGMQLKKAEKAHILSKNINVSKTTDVPSKRVKPTEETYSMVLTNIIEAEKAKKAKDTYNLNLTSYDIDDMYGVIDAFISEKLAGKTTSHYRDKVVKSVLEKTKELNHTFEWKDMYGHGQKVHWSQLTDKQKDILVNVAYRRHFGKDNTDEILFDQIKKISKAKYQERLEVEKVSHIIDNVNIGDDVEIKLYGKDSDADLMNVTISDYRLYDKEHGQIFEYKGINKADGSEVTFYPDDVVNILQIGKITDIEGLVRQSPMIKKAVQHADELKEEFAKLKDEVAATESKYALELEKQVSSIEKQATGIDLTYGSKKDNLEEARENLRDEIKDLQRQTRNERLKIARLKKKQELADEIEAKRIAEEIEPLESKLLEKQKAIMQLQTNEKYFSGVRARKIQNIVDQFERRAASIRNNIEGYEKVAATYQEKLKKAEFETLDDAIEKMQAMEKAIESDELFDSYMRSELGNEKVDKAILKEKFDVIEIALNDDVDVSDKVREIANYFRSHMVEWGREEIGIGKLKKRQLYANLKSYLPHILTPEGKRLISTDVVKGISKFGDDFGYGREFNQFGRRRRFIIKRADGTFNMKPTVAEANKYFEELAKGKNVFSDVMSDIYLTRGLKHNDLMYDDAYMRSMLEMFGDDLVGGIGVRPGHKAVMNFGMAQDGFKELSKVMVKADISDELTWYLGQRDVREEAAKAVRARINAMTFSGSMQKARMYKKIKAEEISRMSSKYIKENFTLERRTEMFQENLKKLIDDSFMRESLDDISTPMIELGDEQITAIQDVQLGVQKRYLSIIKKQYVNLYSEIAGRVIPITKAEKTMLYKKMNGLNPKELKEFMETNGFSRYEGTKYDDIDLLRINKLLEKPSVVDKEFMQIKQVNDAIVEKANRMRKVQIVKDNSRMLQLWDKVTHFIKLNQTTVMPSFHLRNKYSNTFNNWLTIGSDALDLRLQKASAQAMYYMRRNEPEKISHLTINIGGEEKQWSEVYQLAMEYDVVDEGFFKRDLGIGFERGLLGKHINPKFDPTDTKNFVWYKKGAEVGSLIEGQDRLLNFAACLRNGKTPEEAAELTRKALFDYSDLTAFEQNVMKRIIPYYTWLRKNAALQLEMILENPKKYMYISKVVHGIEGMVDEENEINKALVNDFAKDWVQTPFTVTNPEGRKEVVLWNPNLPFMDLGRIPDPTNISNSARELFSQTNPLIKVPIEQMKNYNYFFESPIVDEGDSQLERVNHALSNLATYNFGSGATKKYGVDLGLHVLNATSGLKFLSYDYDVYKYQKLDELRKKYQEKKDNTTPGI